MRWHYKKEGSSGPASGADSRPSRLNEDDPFFKHGHSVKFDKFLKNVVNLK